MWCVCFFLCVTAFFFLFFLAFPTAHESTNDATSFVLFLFFSQFLQLIESVYKGCLYLCGNRCTHLSFSNFIYFFLNFNFLFYLISNNFPFFFNLCHCNCHCHHPSVIIDTSFLTFLSFCLRSSKVNCLFFCVCFFLLRFFNWIAKTRIVTKTKRKQKKKQTKKEKKKNNKDCMPRSQFCFVWFQQTLWVWFPKFGYISIRISKWRVLDLTHWSRHIIFTH